ncbi:HlyD family type I secretion periplasmic adaptor subunit [Bradyrhizobium sp. MOS002]|jgi:HlyD family secretion protein|uniref:HlyD family type I secretion periplasmic adaptor subunit n=1 Tax=Bradyrhizobium sp. MOS002 TaxID=2133947 RepID=UPI000D136EBB|nr:HlyD family type I secretion periplasmic adaptor subunit [Bradyrhizobium sp. MOS002]PSO24161.1 HlyD family type I secretion periplasmic adaptor subunit [Bradyrhizobium sp. MOS002]
MQKKNAIPSWKVPAVAGYVVITGTFVVLGGWSAVAKLDSAVTASGVISVETNRKTVQHLEGGIVREIFVREGQRVEAGAVLFRLDLTAPKAGYELQKNQLDTVVAQEARLVAERDGTNEIRFPRELSDREKEPNVGAAISDQVAQFQERRASLRNQTKILEAKIEQYNSEIEGLKQERAGTTNQLKFVNEELVDVHYLFDRQLTQKSRLMALEREKSRLEGLIGRSIADEAKAQNGIGEAQLQIGQIRQKFLEDVASAMQETRQKINDLREKTRVAQDVLFRVDIMAPSSGVVQNLRVFTVGGVVKPGEAMLDIVPEHDQLIVQAHVQPQDTENLQAGMPAEIRFSAFHTRILPIIMGRVATISHDRLMDEQTRQPYFLAQVIADEIPSTIKERLTAGMPADVIFPTGERTVLDYLVRPLKDRLRGVMREK